MRPYCLVFHHFLSILLALLFFLPSYSLSFFQPLPSDVDYYINETPRFSIIFSEDFLKNNKKDFLYVQKRIFYYDQIYQKIFLQKKLKENPHYVFLSSHTQISNGIASGIPFLRVLFFPSGVDQLANLPVISWLDTVLAHEIAHIYQLGQISENLIYIRAIFKNSQVVFFPFPIFLNTNLVMPQFFLEGYAVLSESMFSKGGRLYSGYSRALVFSQLKHKFETTDQFISEYLINKTSDTFSNRQKYEHGGYFFSSLMQRYSLKRISNIFALHAKHFVIPLSFISIKEVFETNFHTSFESLVNYYIQNYLPMAYQQKQSKKKSLFTSQTCLPFNRKNHRVFFLTSDLKSPPVLRTLNIKTGKWTKQKKVFSNGKVFQIRSKYYVSASHFVSPTEKKYSLFSEGMYSMKKYESQSVQDIYDNNWLSIDTTNNMINFRLLLNGKFYDTTSSSALFGPKGSIYYFKQRNAQKILYKNKLPLFQFKGFYGKLVGIDEKEQIYFIASSQFGSSLFAWNRANGIYRLSDSDVIIDATQGAENQFLVCEVEPESYSYKLIQTKKIFEKPVFYSYPMNSENSKLLSQSNEMPRLDQEFNKEFESPLSKSVDKKDTLEKIFDHSKEDLLSLEAESDLHSNQNYSAYNPFAQIRFTGIDLGILNDATTGYNAHIDVKFKDPMEYNAFQISYQSSFEHLLTREEYFGNWFVRAKYSNYVYRLLWNIQYLYKQGFENFSGSRTYSQIHELGQNFGFPLFRLAYWSALLQLKGSLSSVKIKDFDLENYYYGVKPSIKINYIREYEQNFYYYRHFFFYSSVNYQFKQNSEDYSSEKNLENYHFEYNIRSHYLFSLGYEFYTKLFVNYISGLKPGSIPFRYFEPLSLFKSAELDFFFPVRKLAETNNYFSTGIQLQKVIETPIYFSRYPFSLRSISPLLRVKYFNYLQSSHGHNRKLQLFEWILGTDLGILIHHKVVLQLGIYYGFSHLPNFQLGEENASIDHSFGLVLHSQF